MEISALLQELGYKIIYKKSLKIIKEEDLETIGTDKCHKTGICSSKLILMAIRIKHSVSV